MPFGVRNIFILSCLSLLWSNCAQKGIDFNDPQNTPKAAITSSLSPTVLSNPQSKEPAKPLSGESRKAENAKVKPGDRKGVIFTNEKRKDLKGNKKKGKEIREPKESKVFANKKPFLMKKKSNVHSLPSTKHSIPPLDSSTQVPEDVSGFSNSAHTSLKPKSKKQIQTESKMLTTIDKPDISREKRKSPDQKVTKNASSYPVRKKNILPLPSKSEAEKLHSQKKEVSNKVVSGKNDLTKSISLIQGEPIPGKGGEPKQSIGKPEKVRPLSVIQNLDKQPKGVAASDSSSGHPISLVHSNYRPKSVEEIKGSMPDVSLLGNQVELNATERAGVALGWKAELLRSEAKDKDKSKFKNQSFPEGKGNTQGFSQAKSYLNRSTKTSEIDIDSKRNLNSLENSKDWNQGRGRRAIKLSEQNLDGPRFEEALRWIQQKGK